MRVLGTYGFLGRVQIEEFALGESTLGASSRERVTGESSDDSPSAGS